MSAREELRKLSQAQTAATETLAGAETRREAADARSVELDEQETAAALGETDPAELAQSRAAAEQESRDATSEIRRQRAVLAGLETRIAEAHVACNREELAAMAAELPELDAERFEKEKRLRGALDAAVKHSVAFEKARAAATDVHKQAFDFANEVGLEPPAPVDETDWRPSEEVLQPLLALLKDGPCTPVADNERREAQRARDQERSDRNSVCYAGQELARGSAVPMRGLPKRLWPAVEAEAERLREMGRQDLIAADERNRAALLELGFEPGVTVEEQLAEYDAAHTEHPDPIGSIADDAVREEQASTWLGVAS